MGTDVLMASFGDIYDEFTSALNEEDTEYDAGELRESLHSLSDMELDELYDILTDEDFDYEEFADWCEEHGVRYHG